mmetsp:Transcript_50612/g.133800  ORF Transcript_50612/g.133800 Transcript_50612/m.133800 type:complete len:140 (-) Transcript_50612:1964-2383(-)
MPAGWQHCVQLFSAAAEPAGTSWNDDLLGFDLAGNGGNCMSALDLHLLGMLENFEPKKRRKLRTSSVGSLQPLSLGVLQAGLALAVQQLIGPPGRPAQPIPPQVPQFLLQHIAAGPNSLVACAPRIAAIPYAHSGPCVI